MAKYEVHACTDITGFGLIGHLAEMVIDSGTGVSLDSAAIPILPGTIEFASSGIMPGGLHKNKAFRECMTDFSDQVTPSIQDILFDPQTSGGLLICIPEKDAERLVNELKEVNRDEAAIIGTVVDKPIERIVVR